MPFGPVYAVGPRPHDAKMIDFLTTSCRAVRRSCIMPNGFLCPQSSSRVGPFCVHDAGICHIINFVLLGYTCPMLYGLVFLFLALGICFHDVTLCS